MFISFWRNVSNLARYDFHKLTKCLMYAEVAIKRKNNKKKSVIYVRASCLSKAHLIKKKFLQVYIYSNFVPISYNCFYLLKIKMKQSKFCPSKKMIRIRTQISNFLWLTSLSLFCTKYKIIQFLLFKY